MHDALNRGTGKKKICVLGLDGASAQAAFGDERLANLRRLMDLGVYGRLQSTIPPEGVPAWSCLATSQDPGSLGIYGRDDRYQGLSPSSRAAMDRSRLLDFEAPALSTEIEQAGGKSVVMGSDQAAEVYASADIWAAGESPADSDSAEIFVSGRRQWQLVQARLREPDWDYLHFIDFGLSRLQHRLTADFDAGPEAGAGAVPGGDAVADYYRFLDEQIGSALEALSGDTVVLVASACGAQGIAGTVAINEWLMREGFLVLDQYPGEPTPFAKLKVNWDQTRVSSGGGSCARMFFHSPAREPQAAVPQGETEALEEQLRRKLHGLCDGRGKTLPAAVFAPRDLYRQVRGFSPDLLVEFGAFSWRVVSSVGHSGVYLGENHRRSECELSNPGAHGIFVLAAPHNPLSGEYQGAELLDIAPTLLELGGYPIPRGMQGRSLVAGMDKVSPRRSDRDPAEKTVLDRLAGLGYI